MKPLEKKDLLAIGKIKNRIIELQQNHNWDFHFKMDLGSFETAIEFHAIGYHHPPRSKSWDEVKKQGNTIKCPDMLDWNNRIIIEYEEEPRAGKKMGKLGRKGHTEESDRDEERDRLYRIAGFRFFKVWESKLKSILNPSEDEKDELFEFLQECHKNKKN